MWSFRCEKWYWCCLLIGFGGLARAQNISLNFENISTREALAAIAHFSKMNIVVADNVTGEVSIKIKDVPWETALQSILEVKQLVKKQKDNIIWIVPKQEIEAEQKKELALHEEKRRIEPLHSKTYKLHYGKAVEIEKQLNGQTNSVTGVSSPKILSARGTAIAEHRTNQLIVNDIPERLEALELLLKKMDVPIQQIMITAYIAEVDESYARNLGVKWGGYRVNAAASNTAVTGNYAEATQLAQNPNASLIPKPVVDLTAPSINNMAAASLALSIFSPAAAKLISLELSALEDEGRGKVLANPKIVTADQNKAVIEQGTEIPYPMKNDKGETSLVFKKANLRLEVTPRITPNGQIAMEIDVNKDSLGRLTPYGYAIDTKHLQTLAQVEDGGLLMLGGIYEEADRNEEGRVPVLGEIPLLGWLFKNQQQSKQRSELLIFVSPQKAPTTIELR